MRLQDTKGWKKLLSSALAIVMVIGVFGQCIPEMKTVFATSASTEPTYNAETDELKYSKNALEIAAKGTQSFGVTIPEDKTYYMSFTVKTDHNFYMDYRGTNKARLFISPTQYCAIGVNGKNNYVQKDVGLKNGVKVTICSESDKTSMWFNGEKVLENATLDTKGTGVPKVTWTQNAATMTNVQIWTKKNISDEPTYNAETCELKYEKSTVEIAEKGTQSFGVTIPENETYYMSFTVKTDHNFYMDYRGTNKARLFISPTQYCAIGVNETNTYVQKDVGLKSGVKVTICSEPDKTSMWFNGEKVLENGTLNTTGTGVPKVTWTQNAATMTNVQIWTIKSSVVLPEEPVYNLETDTNFTDNIQTLTLLQGETYNFATRASQNDTIYMSFVAKTTGDLWVNYRQPGRLYLGQTQYGVKGLETETWKPLKTLNVGTKVTIESTPTETSIWVDGVNIVDNCKLGEGEKSTLKYAIPSIAANAEVEFTDMKVWVNRKIDMSSDVPMYNGETDTLFEVQNVSGGTYADGKLTVPAESKSMYITELPYNAEYYFTMKMQSKGSVNIRFRGDAQFIMNKTGYQLTVGENTSWVNWPLNLGRGVVVTIHSSETGVQIWLDQEKVYDESYNADGTAMPGVGWSNTNEVLVSNIQIWATELPSSDEPVYQKETDVLHKITGYGEGIFQNNLLTIEPEKAAYFETDFDADEDYYMSFVVQTEGTINISYRYPDGLINLQKSGYKSMGTQGEWVDKQFEKLPFGLQVTVHSSPEWITIWIGGEKIVDEAYFLEGESNPGVGWSFDNVVTLTDIKLWTNVEEAEEYLGVSETTPERKLSQSSEHGAELTASEEHKAYIDNQPVGKDVPKETKTLQEGQSEIVSSKRVTESNVNSILMMSVPILVTVLFVILAFVQIIMKQRKKEDASL